MDPIQCHWRGVQEESRKEDAFNARRLPNRAALAAVVEWARV
jgi:hypothetical protein